MRIAMISHSLYEADNRVRRYAESLVRRNHSVDVISIGRPGENGFYTLKGVNVYRIRHRDYTEKAKIQYMRNILAFMGRSFLFITRKHMEKRYDFIHVHSVPDFIVLAALVPKLLKCRIILDIHDILPELYMSKFGLKEKRSVYKMLLFIERLSASFADHVIVANHLWHGKLVSRSISKEKCSVIMNFPDDEIFSRPKSSALKKDRDTFTILYPGTLIRHQGIETVLHALEHLREDIPGIRFEIYGKGTDEGYFREMTVRKGLTDIVSFLGVIPIDRIPEIMMSADVGIAPVLNNGFSNEAFSTKIFEFMLVGVPVIVSDTAVHRHYIPDTCVRFFKSGDPESLADAIFCLYTSKDLRARLKETSSEFIRERTWSNKEQEYFNILERLGMKV